MKSVFPLLALSTIASASISQVVVHYSGACELSVDFVSTAEAGTISIDGGAATATSSFEFPSVGWMHQAVFKALRCEPGAPVNYRLDSGGDSVNYTTYATAARSPSEVYAIFGDFGLVNDVIMSALKNESAAGAFDAVLHVGDLAYDLEDNGSEVGNAFMSLVSSSYGSVIPVQVSEGNHESCGNCRGVAALPQSDGNFTQYVARFHGVALGAGARSGSNSARYYSFERGLVHFIVFSAEAYAYDSGAEFIANQLSFIKSDLAAVDRKQTPWVVALVHKDWTMETAAFMTFTPCLTRTMWTFSFVAMSTITTDTPRTITSLAKLMMPR